MKKVIVTGANGFIGSSLIKKLTENNTEVIAVDISFADLHIPENSLVRRIETGLDNTENLLNLIHNDTYDAFYHFAWQGVNGQDKVNPNIQIKNIDMVLNCAKLAKEINCKRFLCAGTIAEQSVNSLHNLKKVSGSMLYGTAKHSARLLLETYCKSAGLDFVWMQFSNIYGPDNKTGNLVSYTLGQLNNNNIASFGPANQPYDFIFVDDLLEAVYRLGCVKNPNNFYYIGSGEPRILKEYLYEIGEVCNKKELIKIGEREDDGIKYTFDMFDISSLKEKIGNYKEQNFSERIKYTAENY